MMTLFSAIFYLWLVLGILLALLLFLREQDRRRTERREAATDDELLSDMLPEPEQDAEPVPEDAEPEPEIEVVTEPEPDMEPEAEAEMEQETEAEAEMEQETEAEAEAKVEQEVESADATLQELLGAVDLPYDMITITEHVSDPAAHLIFLSDHPDAAEVGTAFADRLAGQGFEIEPAGFDQAIASRDGQVLSLRISPEAGTVLDEDRQRYAGAGDSDVAIEVWLGNGSPPPLAD